MLFPILCVPPWSKYKYSGAKINLSLQQNNIESVQSEISSLIVDNRPMKSSAIPINTALRDDTRKKRGESSFRSSLASSHLSTTPKFHTLSMSDTQRIHKQYEKYLKKQQKMKSAENECKTVKETGNTSKSMEESEYFAKQKLTPSKSKKKNSETLSAPNLNDKYLKNGYRQDEEQSSDEYDSEGMDSINLRVGSFDAINYKFASVTYHEDEN